VDATCAAPQSIDQTLAARPPVCRAAPGPADPSVDPCNDLFRASCIKPDGSFKNEPDIADLLDKKIRAAREAAIKGLGGSLENAEQAYLARKGIVLRDLTDAEKTALFSDPDNTAPTETETLLKNPPRSCQNVGKLSTDNQKKVDELTEQLSNAPAASQPGLRAQIDRIYAAEAANQRSISDEYARRMEVSYGTDIPALADRILNLCKSELPQNIDINRSSEPLPADCSTASLYKLRSDAVESFRVSDSERGKALGAELARRYFPRLVALLRMSQRVRATPSTPDAPNRGSEELRVQSEITRGFCDETANTLRAAFTDAKQEFFNRLTRSRPMVETLVAETYGPARKAAMDKVFGDVKSGMLNLLATDFANAPNVDKITSGMRNLGYDWVTAPDARYYRNQDGFALPILDVNALPEDTPGLFTFQYPSVGWFRELNAEYQQRQTVGEHVKQAETIELRPALALMAETDPYAAMATLAHEMGHKIGFTVSKENGYDLQPFYRKLADCLRSADSIHATDKTLEEAIPDWISSKIMGRFIAQKPPAERKNAALRLSGFFCQILAKTFATDSLKISLGTDHPDVMLRFNGIFGANPDVRRALGCTSPPRIHECGLNGVVK
jgi:hypothetical protein